MNPTRVRSFLLTLMIATFCFPGVGAAERILDSKAAAITALSDGTQSSGRRFRTFLEDYPGTREFLLAHPAASEWLELAIQREPSNDSVGEVPPSLTPNEIAELNTYKTYSFKEDNARLRRGEPCGKRCESLREGLRKLKTFRGLTYRGIRSSQNSTIELYLREGGIAVDQGFVSSSTSPGVATSFTGQGPKSLLLVIIGDVGARYFDYFSNKKFGDSESEVIFLPGTPMKVHMVMKQDDGSHIVFLSAIPK